MSTGGKIGVSSGAAVSESIALALKFRPEDFYDRQEVIGAAEEGRNTIDGLVKAARENGIQAGQDISETMNLYVPPLNSKNGNYKGLRSKLPVDAKLYVRANHQGGRQIEREHRQIIALVLDEGHNIAQYAVK